jgi:hypothetical protein
MVAGVPQPDRPTAGKPDAMVTALAQKRVSGIGRREIGKILLNGALSEQVHQLVRRRG